MEPPYLSFAALIFFAGLATGCLGYQLESTTTAPSAFSRPSEKSGKICVFRPHGLGTSVVAPVSDNGAIVGATEGSSYFCYLAEPGSHRIRTGDAPPLVFDVEEHREYYVAHDLNVGKDGLIRITRESAHQLSSWCNNMVVERAPASVSVLKTGMVARAGTPGVLATGTAANPARKVAWRAAAAPTSAPKAPSAQ
jgi:hypothetical protein